MSEVAIKVNNLSKSYANQKVLHDVTFEIYKSEIICIAGGSGCGKSTLMKQIIGLEEPDQGNIYYGSEQFFPASEKQKRKLINKIGVMFQMGGLFASLSVGENIALPLQTFTSMNEVQIEEIIKMKLCSVGLQGYENYYPSELSGGMKKRASLARAMALDPDFLFFDEPSSGLDPVTAASLDNLIREINAALKTTMIIVTHDLASIMEIADRVILLDKSIQGIYAIGKPSDLQNSEDIIISNFFNREFD
ncbi:MAG: hypothetical protein A2X64_11365 [Ignavibacteria bacterium GWF2_33_9]|nr:MAG: hypothetical protein A2X64_11365 [Ignavibacteria bacterium GWF2_33_9]